MTTISGGPKPRNDIGSQLIIHLSIPSSILMIGMLVIVSGHTEQRYLEACPSLQTQCSCFSHAHIRAHPEAVAIDVMESRIQLMSAVRPYACGSRTTIKQGP